MTRYAYPARRPVRTRDWIAAIEQFRRAFADTPATLQPVASYAPAVANPLQPAINFRPRFYRFDAQ